jgi:hypothetical protein
MTEDDGPENEVFPFWEFHKNKSSKSGKISPLKIVRSNHHNPPSIHHRLTTNSPSKNTTFRPTPFQKAL